MLVDENSIEQCRVVLEGGRDSFEFKVEALDDAMVNMMPCVSILLPSKPNAFCLLQLFWPKDKGLVVEEVIYGCIGGLDGRISDCKLAMHANCFDQIRKNMMNNIGNNHDSTRKGRHVSILNRLKWCCQHSMRDVYIQPNGAWWKLKKYCTLGVIFIYRDICIICL